MSYEEHDNQSADIMLPHVHHALSSPRYNRPDDERQNYVPDGNCEVDHKPFEEDCYVFRYKFIQKAVVAVYLSCSTTSTFLLI